MAHFPHSEKASCLPGISLFLAFSLFLIIQAPLRAPYLISHSPEPANLTYSTCVFTSVSCRQASTE